MSWHNQYELIYLLSGHYVMRRKVSMSFLLLLLYLITVACILEISLGSCWHKDERMGQRSTINHNVHLFISLNNQYAVIMIIQWPPVEIYMCKLCPNQISITIWKFTTWVCIEYEVEVATSTKANVYFYYFLNSFFTTLTLQIFLCQHAPKRSSSARNASSSTKIN